MEPIQVSHFVAATLKALGYGRAKSLGCRVLSRKNRQYAGVHFLFEGVSAIWLTDSDHVKFFNESGELFKAVRLDASPQLARKAA
jgi:hypothetical protein